MSRQCIALVCDRSGSMMGKKTDTVGGINSCIEELKSKKEEDTYINIMLKLFDHEQIIVWDNIEIKEIEEFKESQFIPRGQTALLDAMGDTISYYINKKKDDDLFYDDCCIYVITDGLENASTKWTKELIKELINNAEINYNIKVMYLAANQNAILEADNFGITSDRAINYSETRDTINAVYRSIATSAYRTRTGGLSGFLNIERELSINTNESDLNPLPISRNIGRFKLRNQTNNFVNDIPEWKQHQILDAAKQNKWNVVLEMLNETPNLINTEGGASKRWTLLHHAVYTNNMCMVDELIKRGADKTIINSDGKIAIELTNDDIIKSYLNSN